MIEDVGNIVYIVDRYEGMNCALVCKSRQCDEKSMRY